MVTPTPRARPARKPGQSSNNQRTKEGRCGVAPPLSTNRRGRNENTMPVLRHIYDSATGTYHDVEVSQEIYNCYRRTAWGIQKNDKRFYANEIQFSSLIGGLNQAFENFDEFRTTAGDPQQILCDATMRRRILEAFQGLSPSERRILQLLVIEGHPEQWYADRTGLSQQTVHNRKKSALRKLQKVLDKHR